MYVRHVIVFLLLARELDSMMIIGRFYDLLAIGPGPVTFVSIFLLPFGCGR
jgi:hypothetical protein